MQNCCNLLCTFLCTKVGLNFFQLFKTGETIFQLLLAKNGQRLNNQFYVQTFPLSFCFCLFVSCSMQWAGFCCQSPKTIRTDDSMIAPPAAIEQKKVTIGSLTNTIGQKKKKKEKGSKYLRWTVKLRSIGTGGSPGKLFSPGHHFLRGILPIPRDMIDCSTWNDGISVLHVLSYLPILPYCTFENNKCLLL